MKYKKLGRTGLLVSELCFGTMTFGGRGFWSAIGQLPQDAADNLVGRVLEVGVNFLDTADIHSEGESKKSSGSPRVGLSMERRNGGQDEDLCRKC
jgi:aryl-alcohol dehydrogenase-like predicted oxidoreductase